MWSSLEGVEWTLQKRRLRFTVESVRSNLKDLYLTCFLPNIARARAAPAKKVAAKRAPKKVAKKAAPAKKAVKKVAKKAAPAKKVAKKATKGRGKKWAIISSNSSEWCTSPKFQITIPLLFLLNNQTIAFSPLLHLSLKLPIHLNPYTLLPLPVCLCYTCTRHLTLCHCLTTCLLLFQFSLRFIHACVKLKSPRLAISRL